MNAFVAALFRPVDLASRVVFRMAFAVILLWELWRFQHYRWIERYWIEPGFSFKYYGFGWVEAWPGNGMFVHVAALAVLAAMIFAGLFYRVAAALFCVGFTYVFLLDQSRYLNHFYLVCLLALLLIFVPAHRTFSLDARLRPGIRSATAPAWSLWLLRFQLGVVYVYGGIAKLGHDWLRGEPIGHWIAPLGDTPLIGPLFVQPWSGLLFAYSGLLIDLGVVPLLLWRRTRPLGFAIVVLFNVMNGFMFNIGIFPWMMVAAATLFFEPDWPRRLVRKLRRATAGDAAGDLGPAAAVVTSPLPLGRKVALVAMAVYVAIQLLVPFRHFLYPGTVHWTEEGHRFAWHMKLRDKTAQCWFAARDPATGERWDVYPEDLLEDWQEYKLCTHPDMILQVAHHIAAEAAAEGVPDLEVHAQAFASLHGRPFQSLIDSDVNLALEPRTLRAARWIRPLNAEAAMGDF